MPEAQTIKIETPATPLAGGAAPASGLESSSPLPVADKGDAGAATIIDGGGSLDAAEPGATPATWPANWRDIAAGGDAKTLGYLNRYASPVNVVKALMATRQKISTGELLRTKPDGEDETALNEWRAQAGVPEKPEGYLEKLPDGLIIGEDDKPNVESFLTRMHAADAPPALVHEALGWYYATQEKQAAERAEADRANRAKNEDALRSEWGPEYRPNLNAVHALIDSHGSADVKEKLFGARLADGTPLGDDPHLLRFLAGVSREINPHGTVTPGAGQTPLQGIESEIGALELEMKDTKGKAPDGYWRNETKQKRLRDLYDMRERHKGRG